MGQVRVLCPGSWGMYLSQPAHQGVCWRGVEHDQCCYSYRKPDAYLYTDGFALEYPPAVHGPWRCPLLSFGRILGFGAERMAREDVGN